MTGKQLKNSILQWAIQGKLVPQDPNEEPTSILLERIREEKKRLIKEGKIKKDKNETIIYRGEDNSYYEKVVATGEVKCIDDEIPFEIPEGWEWVRISDITQPNPKNVVSNDTPAAFIPMEKIDATYLSSYTYATRKWGDIKNGFTHFANGDIAFAKITPCFQNRKSVILKDLPNGIGAGTTELKVLRTYGDTIVKEYLLFFLESPYFVEEAIFKGTANQQRIISGYLENKLFPLPPFSEQKRIVGKIMEAFVVADKYGKAQSNLDILNSNLRALLRKSVLQEAIQGRLVLQIPEEGTAQELLEQIKQEKARLVKEGKLKKTALQDSVIFKGGDNRYYEQIGTTISDITEEIPFNAPISWQWVRLSSVTYPVGSKINQIQSKDILPTGLYPVVSQSQKLVDGYADEQGKVIYDLPLVMFGDHTRVVKLIDFPFIIGADGTKFHKSILIDTHYLYYWMKTMANSLRNRGYARYYSLLKSCPIPLPPIKEQHRIVARIKQLFQKL